MVGGLNTVLWLEDYTLCYGWRIKHCAMVGGLNTVLWLED